MKVKYHSLPLLYIQREIILLVIKKRDHDHIETLLFFLSRKTFTENRMHRLFSLFWVREKMITYLRNKSGTVSQKITIKYTL